MHTSLALVHHANQYLITDGYENREGLAAVVGHPGSGSGLAFVLDLHARYGIPLNLHISGTLLEAIAWHRPEFLEQVRDLHSRGLIEFVGSCYGQNIMRFFGPEYNRKQLNEELLLHEAHLGVDVAEISTFWPPERVWETAHLAPVLRDAGLRNNGYRYVILDDRLLLSRHGGSLPRPVYDDKQHWAPELFQMHEIEGGLGLCAFPIATRLRRSIPPRKDEDWVQVQHQLESLLIHEAGEAGANLLALYADDMEKVAGIGEWGGEGPVHYENFLRWLTENSWVRPVKLSSWAAQNGPSGTRHIETGTFEELARQFEAGEGYENWYNAPDWAPYRAYFDFAESRVREAAGEGADPALLTLAEKQLLVGNWETAWHTPAVGPHGDPDVHGHASPWARALTSHVRHAAVTAQAARWMANRDDSAHVDILDLDDDGEDEVVLRNSALYVVITPRWGGRVVAMFSVGGERGSMVVGNPCDDWNWMEDLNKFMEVPRNHPGCFADAGFENDRYSIFARAEQDGSASVTLINQEEASAARKLVKHFRLAANDARLFVDYRLRGALVTLTTDFGLSPDYLALLRGGSRIVRPFESGLRRGFATGSVSTWIELPGDPAIAWTEPPQPRFGHGCMLRVTAAAREFSLALGVRHNDPDQHSLDMPSTVAEPVR